MIGEIVAYATAIATLVGVVATIVDHGRRIRATRRLEVVIIGCHTRVQVPEPLKHLRKFTSYAKALASGEKKVILYVDRVSAGLRQCDFMIVDPLCDTKLVVKGTSEGETRISELSVRN